ncbi:NAD(P)H nitroreductase [Mycobacterium sp. pW049]|uniref:Acg family FMN-binding oxidoreductase n=1 Tax=[Mycobacterium] bulgaricum TaxID=3238985 RepID=UPI00351B0D29
MPATRVPTETIMDALTVACRAPSLHNSQPWRWVATERGVDLFADPRRMIRATDSTGREALISCGAVLDHFRVAMAAAGWDTVVRRLPDPDNPLHIACVDVAAAPRVTAQQKARADAILLRRTDRLPMSAPQDWDGLARALGDAAQRASVQAHPLADDARGALSEACHLAETMRMYDSGYHSELFWWTADFVADDGIPRSALISAAESDRVDVGRAFPVTGHPERRGEVEDDRAGILVLSTEDDSRESVLRCGEALSAVLLDATISGLATCTVTHVTEVPSGRDTVASLVGTTAIPQVIVRVGVAPALAAPPPPTPRRPVREVFEMNRGAPC